MTKINENEIKESQDEGAVIWMDDECDMAIGYMALM